MAWEGCYKICARIAKNWQRRSIQNNNRCNFSILRLADFINFPRVFGGGFVYKFFMADSFRLKDQPASERPRERLVARGPDALTHAELIAILLRTGPQGANVVQGAQNILQIGRASCRERGE